MDLRGNGLHQSEDVFQQEVAFWNHSQNICARVGVACKECHDRARAALRARDWAAAKAEWERCLNLVRPSSLWAAVVVLGQPSVGQSLGILFQGVWRCFQICSSILCFTMLSDARSTRSPPSCVG